MHITLIGMSNIGKTHWAKKLAAERGFIWLDCDRLIEQKLKAENVELAASGTEGLARWMGHPSDPHYAETSRVYIEREREVMLDVIERLRVEPARKPYVIDTTGSIIYMGDEILEVLKSLTKVIYFEASRGHEAEIYARYETDPKPLIWDNAYQPRPGERPEAARQRCFPDLLESRARRYAEMAHVKVPFEQHKKFDANIDVLFGHGK